MADQPIQRRLGSERSSNAEHQPVGLQGLYIVLSCCNAVWPRLAWNLYLYSIALCKGCSSLHARVALQTSFVGTGDVTDKRQLLHKLAQISQ